MLYLGSYILFTIVGHNYGYKYKRTAKNYDHYNSDDYNRYNPTDHHNDQKNQCPLEGKVWMKLCVNYCYY